MCAHLRGWGSSSSIGGNSIGLDRSIGPVVLFETRADVVMMDKLAGGSGGVGPVFHGRKVDGATLTPDMAVAVRGPAGRGEPKTTRC
jgi:hypothetical protein